MNRKLTTAIVLALILTLGLAVTAMAQGNGPMNGANDSCPQGEFIDANSDGVCDNAAQDGAGMQFQRGNSNGSTASAGPNFADADGDGVCDKFIDEDGDGVSDNQVGAQNRGRRGSQVRGQQSGIGRNMQGRQHGFRQGVNNQ